MNRWSFGKLRDGEEVVPDRPELRGTVAERLAAMRADAAFALWAVRFGPGSGEEVVREQLDFAAERMWADCRRPDWMLDALALSKAYGAGNDLHRRVTAFLVAGVRARVDVSTLGARVDRLLKLAGGWAGATPASVLTVPAREVVKAADAVNVDVSAAMRALAAEDGRDGERAAYLAFAAVSAAYFAGVSVFDPRACATAAMVLSLLSTAGEGVASDEVAAEVRGAFAVPEELRS